jgi:hypothetical protein
MARSADLNTVTYENSTYRLVKRWKPEDVKPDWLYHLERDVDTDSPWGGFVLFGQEWSNLETALMWITGYYFGGGQVWKPESR